jgi:hypothetical protein
MLDRRPDPYGLPLTSSMPIRPTTQQMTAALQLAGGGHGGVVLAVKSGQLSDI